MEAIGKEKEEYDGKTWDIGKNGCPDCACREFLQGPSGAMCVNIMCSCCHKRFNVGPGKFCERIT